MSFGSRTIVSRGVTVVKVQLGSNRVSGVKYYPYGEEQGAGTANDKDKYATYYRDATTGLDYAQNRYYASTLGRFLSPDPYAASAGPSDPGSWNRYAYTAGDPINRVDPSGKDYCLTNDLDTVCLLAPLDPGGGSGYSTSTPYCGTVNYISTPQNDPGCWQSPPLSISPPAPSCDELEIAYVFSYLSKRKSPLAADAGEIVEFSDAFGIDDRFVVALAGAETTYGTSPTWDSATTGIYNVFDNGAHCAGLKPKYFCVTVNPYKSYGEAIYGVVQALGSSKLYLPYSSTKNIYSVYEEGNVNKAAPQQDLLDQIYGRRQLNGDLNNIRHPRCP